MEKPCTLLILSILIVATISFSSVQGDYNPGTKLPDATLTFYVQDALSGPNATVWEVARANITSTSKTDFGQVRVVDDLITSGPDPNSEKLGRFQGMVTSSDMQKIALVYNMVFVLDQGTISVLGRSEILNDTRELVVTGGTGIYRMARGYAIASTSSSTSEINEVTHATFEYNVNLYNPF